MAHGGVDLWVDGVPLGIREADVIVALYDRLAARAK
jgi:hypothetical protein